MKTDNRSDLPHPPGRMRRSKGRILRLKEGYNPNSSSIGSIVFLLPAATLAAAAGFGAVAAFICSAFTGKNRSDKKGTPCEGERREDATPPDGGLPR